MTPGEREEIEKVARDLSLKIFIEMNMDFEPPICLPDDCHKWIADAILTQVEKARRKQIEIDAKHYKRLVKIFLGEEAEIEFSEKMAKGFNNLVKFLSADSATN